MTKTCFTCLKDKAIEDFPKRKGGKTHSSCLECTKIYSKSHYLKNKEKHNKRRYAHNKINRKLVRDFLHDLKEVPCKDCGVEYPYWVMQFDHVNGTKNFELGSFGSRSLQAVLAEISKCELVCANCHCTRTHIRSMMKLDDGE